MPNARNTCSTRGKRINDSDWGYAVDGAGSNVGNIEAEGEEVVILLWVLLAGVIVYGGLLGGSIITVGIGFVVLIFGALAEGAEKVDQEYPTDPQHPAGCLAAMFWILATLIVGLLVLIALGNAFGG